MTDKRVQSPTSYVVVGHICVDELPGTPARLGGTAFFAAGQADAMGFDVAVLTAGTSATAEWARRELPDEVVVCSTIGEFDTRFGFDAEADTGPQRLLSLGPELDLEAWNVLDESKTQPLVIHLGPIFAEISADLILRAGEIDSFVGITPQGFMRSTTDSGALRYELSDWDLVSSVADALVLNDAEFTDLEKEGLLEQVRGVIFRTHGPNGASVYIGGALVATATNPSVRDVESQRTIGAGDVFATAAFAAMARGCDAEESVDVAMRSATAYVQRSTDRPSYFDMMNPEDVSR